MPRITVAELAEQVAALTGMVSTLVEAQPAAQPAKKGSRKAASKDIVTAGSEFNYTNTNGEVTLHTVSEVKGRGDQRRAWTDQGQRFKLSTLAKLNGSQVEIL